jgi:solute carrier family 25 (mitochondrial phosphate transporter), member 3
MTGSDVHDMTYYKKCMMGGILSCGITHTIVCPLDIVKCRMQVSLLSQNRFKIPFLSF